MAFGGSWDLVATYNGAYNPTYDEGGIAHVSPVRATMSRVISPDISGYYVP